MFYIHDSVIDYSCMFQIRSTLEINRPIVFRITEWDFNYLDIVYDA